MDTGTALIVAAILAGATLAAGWSSGFRWAGVSRHWRKTVRHGRATLRHLRHVAGVATLATCVALILVATVRHILEG